MKKKFFSIIILAVFLAITANANAAQINFAQIFSEFRHYSTPFTYEDQYFMQAFAYVDVNKTVYLQNVPGASGDEPFIYIPSWSNPPIEYEYDKYFTTVDGYPSPGPVWEDRNYNFYIEGNLDNKGYYIPSGSINQMGVPSSVTISGGFNPTITWDDVDYAEYYRVRFFQIGDNGNPDRSLFLGGSGRIFDTDASTYSYQYTGDFFKVYGTLAVAVEANDVSDGGQWLNRSVHYSQHDPAAKTAGMPWIPLLLLDKDNSLPQPGGWSGSAGFGELSFTVDSTSTSITQLVINYIDFSCGGILSNGTITATSFWPVTDRQFNITTGSPDREITIIGTFDKTGEYASGTYDAVFNGTTCSGTWDATPN